MSVSICLFVSSVNTYLCALGYVVLVEATQTTASVECSTIPKTTSTNTTYLGAVSDRAVMAYFAKFSMESDTTAHMHTPMQRPHSPRLPALVQPSIQISQPSQSPKRVSALTASRPIALPQPQPPTSTFTFETLLSCPLHLLALPSLEMYASVIAATSSSTVLDAMRLMSDCGVSSVAVVDDGGGGYGAGYGSWGGLTGAVSVTDVGKVCSSSLYRSAEFDQFFLSFHELYLTSIYVHHRHVHTARRSLTVQPHSLRAFAPVRRTDQRARW